MTTPRPIRVGLVGAFDRHYPRHQILIAGLERHGITVKQFQLSRGTSTLRQIPALLKLRPALRYCDVVLVAAFNPLLAPLIGLLVPRRKLIIDYMVGLSDGLVEERGQVAPLKRRLYAAIDRYNLRRFDTLTDTQAHKRWFERFTGHALPNLMVVPVGVYDRWFSARPLPAIDDHDHLAGDRLLVQFFGSYIPFHGVEVIIEAAAQLAADPRLHFEIIGRGQTYPAIHAEADRRGLTNVTFSDHVPPELLPERVAQASICLGVFGARDKTDYVVPNKVYQCLAIGRPLITAKSAALDEYFAAGRDLITVPPGDPSALAAAIHQLTDSPEARARLGHAATDRIATHFLPEQVTAPLVDRIRALA